MRPWVQDIGPLHYNADFPYYPYAYDDSVVWRTSDHDLVAATFKVGYAFYLPILLNDYTVP
jgi:hypothetical protein